MLPDASSEIFHGSFDLRESSETTSAQNFVYQPKACIIIILYNYSYVSVRIVPGEGRQCILSIESYTVILVMGSVDSKESTGVCFTVAGMDKMEVKNQQIQTEIVKTVEQHVQAGSTAKQQGV